jgi:hypothetical protein
MRMSRGSKHMQTWTDPRVFLGILRNTQSFWYTLVYICRYTCIYLCIIYFSRVCMQKYCWTIVEVEPTDLWRDATWHGHTAEASRKEGNLSLLGCAATRTVIANSMRVFWLYEELYNQYTSCWHSSSWHICGRAIAPKCCCLCLCICLRKNVVRLSRIHHELKHVRNMNRAGAWHPCRAGMCAMTNEMTAWATPGDRWPTDQDDVACELRPAGEARDPSGHLAPSLSASYETPPGQAGLGSGAVATTTAT